MAETLMRVRLPIIWMIFVFFSALIIDGQSPPDECSNVVLDLADCLSFVVEGSLMNKPEGACCSGLKNVLKTNAECLCEAFSSSAQLGVKLNASKAMTLPAACHLDSPSISDCGPDFVTGAAPAPSPSVASPTSIVGTPTTTNIGVNEIGSPPAPKSGSYSLGTSFWLFILITTFASAALLTII